MITQEHMGRYFKMIQIRLEHFMNRQLQALELTSAQGHIIGYLTCAKEPPCARDIEGFFRLSHPTVSGLLSRMEAKGFVEVCPDPADRRIKRIYLLEKGYACSRQIRNSILENDRRMVRGFTPEEEAMLKRLLERAIENLSDEAESSPPEREE